MTERSYQFLKCSSVVPMQFKWYLKHQRMHDWVQYTGQLDLLLMRLMTAAEHLTLAAAMDLVFNEMRKHPENEVFKSLYAQVLQQQPSGQAPRPETPPISTLPPIQTSAAAPACAEHPAEATAGPAGGSDVTWWWCCQS